MTERAWIITESTLRTLLEAVENGDPIYDVIQAIDDDDLAPVHKPTEEGSPDGVTPQPAST